jgi:hypothetical protein
VFSTRSGGQGDLDDDAEINVTHFIPSVHLKGTRTEKLEKLDLLITHLEGLRRSIAEQPALPREVSTGPSMQLTRADRWWAAGLLVAASLVLVVLGVRACTTTNDNGLSVRPQPGVARLLPAMAKRAEFPRGFDARSGGGGTFSAHARELSGPRVSAN